MGARVRTGIGNCTLNVLNAVILLVRGEGLLSLHIDTPNVAVHGGTRYSTTSIRAAQT